MKLSELISKLKELSGQFEGDPEVLVWLDDLECAVEISSHPDDNAVAIHDMTKYKNEYIMTFPPTAESKRYVLIG